MLKMLTFDPVDHKYFWEGRQVPGVTSIIGQYKKVNVYGQYYYVDTFKGGVISVEKFEAGADHGKAVHEAIKFDLTCGVDEDSLHPVILGSLNQFRIWKDENVSEIILVEEPLYSVRYGYAGTPDLVCRMKKKKNLALPDIKTGLHAMSGPQTAAYEQLFREKDRYKGYIDRFTLELPKSGDSHRLIIETNKNDFNFFRSRLFDYNFLGGM